MNHRTHLRFSAGFCSVPAAVLLAAVLLAGCSRSGTGDAKGGKPGKPGAGAPVPVLAAKAAVKTLPVELRAVGNVEALSTVSVRARVRGQVARVHFREGQEVRKDDLLFTLDPRPAQAALDQARAALAQSESQADGARLEFERQKKLLESALSPADAFDKAEADYKTLQAAVLAGRAAVSNALLNLEFTEIRAPADGRAGSLLVHEGNLVKADDDVLVVIKRTHPVYVAFSVPEKHLPEIRARLAAAPAVEARLPDTDAPPQRGELAFVDNAVDPATGTIRLKAVFANDGGVLWPGGFAEVRLILKEQTGVTVPSQAVQTGQNGDFVFVVNAAKTAEMRKVTPGLVQNGETLVEEGLSEGETVVTDGQLRLIPGAVVNIRTTLTPSE